MGSAITVPLFIAPQSIALGRGWDRLSMRR